MAELAAIADQAHASDLFVLSNLNGDQFVNLDGHGRGSGWAGNIHVHADEEPFLSTALELGIARTSGSLPRRIFGPYWANNAVGVGDRRGIVVFAGEQLAELTDDRFRALGSEVLAVVHEVPVAKRLADELELAQAELGVTKLSRESIETTGTALAEHAASALSCEFAGLLISDREPRVFIADLGWQPPATNEELIAAMLPLARAARRGLVVEQELALSPLAYRPLSAEDGLVSLAAVPLGEQGEFGALVVGHSGNRPRGFTDLCQLVLRRIGETATPVLGEALSRR